MVSVSKTEAGCLIFYFLHVLHTEYATYGCGEHNISHNIFQVSCPTLFSSRIKIALSGLKASYVWNWTVRNPIFSSCHIFEDINRIFVCPTVADRLNVSVELRFIQWWFIHISLPCSLVLGILPQGLVAVTVAAQVASMSARFSTPILFFLPVAKSHSPQASNSYLHSPKEDKEIRHLIRCFCFVKWLWGGDWTGPIKQKTW